MAKKAKVKTKEKAKKKSAAKKPIPAYVGHPPDRKPKMDRDVYEDELEKLQAQLVALQEWVVANGERIIVIFEGRDAAGKGGVLRRITERVSPRVFRTVALPAPTEREKSQIYFQRYIQHFPAAGEITLFDRSWYNRAGVERVMSFCSADEYDNFMRVCPAWEREIVHEGIRLIKYYFDVSQAEQEKRFNARINDPIRQWKLSPMDVESYRRWWDYSKAIDDMFMVTDTEYAPWYVVHADDKRRARLNCIAHLLSIIPYEEIPVEKAKLPRRQARPKALSETRLYEKFVPGRY